MNKVMFSSKYHDWETPQEFFDELDKEFHFEIDVCATSSNTKCDQYYSPKSDSLNQAWLGVCWMNPPYGRGIGEWLKKAYESSLAGSTIVCLIPSRTDTKWWHDYVMQGDIRFIKGRLKFKRNGKESNNCPFPCAVVIFKGNKTPGSAKKEDG